MTEGIEEGSLVDAPDSIIHRDREVEQLSRLLDPDAQSEGAETVFITGPTGSGKTYTAKYTVDQLRRTHPRLEAVYVNRWEDHSRFQVLYQILDEIMTTVDIYRRSTPRDLLLDRLREYDRGPCIVVLDEVDQLDDKGLLYELLNLPRFSLFLIANFEDDLLNGLDERLARSSPWVCADSFRPLFG